MSMPPNEKRVPATKWGILIQKLMCVCLQGWSREDAEVVLRTGKEYQTYLAGQAGWQEKMPNHDADAILRPLLKIMCRQDLSWSEYKNLCHGIARRKTSCLSTQLRLRHGSVQICREVTRQKKRLGGDFAVAHLVMSRKSRDLCRDLHLKPFNKN